MFWALVHPSKIPALGVVHLMLQVVVMGRVSCWVKLTTGARGGNRYGFSSFIGHTRARCRPELRVKQSNSATTPPLLPAHDLDYHGESLNTMPLPKAPPTRVVP